MAACGALRHGSPPPYKKNCSIVLWLPDGDDKNDDADDDEDEDIDSWDV